MALSIKAVKHGKKNYNRYCGPGALSAITGITAENAAKRIAEWSHGPNGCARRAKKYAKNAGRTGMGYGVTGTPELAMKAVLRDLGYRAIKQETEERCRLNPGRGWESIAPAEFKERGNSTYNGPTLTQWDNERTRTTDVFLIVLTTHYVVVQGDKIVDNQIITPRSLAGGNHYRRARVREVYRITKSVA